MRNFRNYEVWRLAIAFGKQIYELTNLLPSSEAYGIISQLQRAGISISSNIAEGCSRRSERDFARFIEIAQGSAFEVESLLTISLEIGYIDPTQYEKLIANINLIQKKLTSLYLKLNTIKR